MLSHLRDKYLQLVLSGIGQCLVILGAVKNWLYQLKIFTICYKQQPCQNLWTTEFCRYWSRRHFAEIDAEQTNPRSRFC